MKESERLLSEKRLGLYIFSGNYLFWAAGISYGQWVPNFEIKVEKMTEWNEAVSTIEEWENLMKSWKRPAAMWKKRADGIPWILIILLNCFQLRRAVGIFSTPRRYGDRGNHTDQ